MSAVRTRDGDLPGTARAHESSAVRIRAAEGARDLASARALFEEYVASLGVDLSFQDIASELSTLPGAYAPPGGCIFLAEIGGIDVGCIALRPLVPPAEGEVKRLYVRPVARGSGAGEALVRTLLDAARAAGYATLKLDSLESMHEARRLYRRMGFAPCTPYYANPLPGAVYMDRSL